jgi:hypothetical protein
VAISNLGHYRYCDDCLETKTKGSSLLSKLALVDRR